MSYWKVPIEILEEETQLEKWVEQSFEISLKNKQNKKGISNHKLQSF
jgi:TfoX/Sxy family transcriptional regulator of competence genes